MVTEAFGASTGPAVRVATTTSSPLVVTGPTTVLPPRLTFRSPVDVMLWIASNFTVTSPAYSVLITSTLPSDFVIEPVNRSAFFKTSWSASAGIAHSRKRITTDFLCTRGLLNDWTSRLEFLLQGCRHNGIPQAGSGLQPCTLPQFIQLGC